MEKDAQRTFSTLRKTALNLIKMYRDAYAPKSSLVAIMRINLFDPSGISQFFERLGVISGL